MESLSPIQISGGYHMPTLRLVIRLDVALIISKTCILYSTWRFADKSLVIGKSKHLGDSRHRCIWKKNTHPGCNRFAKDCPAEMRQFNVTNDPIETCNQYIKSEPDALGEAYWKIRGVYVYEREMEVVPHSHKKDDNATSSKQT